MNKEILNTKNLGFAYNKDKEPLFTGLNLTINQGEVVLLIGENGIGKSTLLNCLVGNLKPSIGEVFLDLSPLTELSRITLAKKIAVVSSKNEYNDLMNVYEFVAFGRYPYSNWLGKIGNKDEEVILQSIEFCGLKGGSGKMMNSLSDGERQKVIIARALAQQTEIVVLDEPTTHLDIKNSKRLLNLLKNQSTTHNKTIIFSSHQVERALEIADKVLLFMDKKVVETTPLEFLNSSKMKSIIFGEN